VNDVRAWWLAMPQEGFLLWARLSLRDDGRADVLDASGLTRRFDDEDAARHFLLDLGYVAYDGLDDEDAHALGFALGEIEPPEAEDEREQVHAMTQRLERRN
jgi:hypothetical protein